MSQNSANKISQSSSGDMAVIGEGTPNRTPVSIQVLQNIYHELTGKSEEVSKSYDEAFHLEFNDFKQLNFRIEQACEQYNLCSSNCNVSVFYTNDTKDKFSSFERFEAFNTGSTSSVESVLLTYNFLIILPKIAEPQSYTVTIRIANPVAIQRKMSEGMFGMVPKIARFMGAGRTAVVSVKYVDYAVARTVLNTIDDWFSGLPRTKSGPIICFLRKHTDYLPLLTRYLAALVGTAVVVANIDRFVPADAHLADLAKFLVLATAGVFFLYKLAEHAGSAAEDSLDRVVDLAYICITNGDRRELALAKSRNRGALAWGTIKLVGGLLLSVAAKIIVYKIVSA